MLKKPKNSFTLLPEFSPSTSHKKDYEFGNYLTFNNKIDNTASSLAIKFGNGTSGSYDALRRAQTNNGTISAFRFKACSEAHMKSIETHIHDLFKEAEVAVFRSNGKQSEIAIIDASSLPETIDYIKKEVEKMGGKNV